MTRPGVGVVAEAHRSVTGMPRYILPLPFQSPPLSLNDPTPRGKGARGRRARVVREIRSAVVLRATQLRMRAVPHVHVVLHYVPRDRRTRDPDNLVATLKPCLDAMTAKGRDRGWICCGIVPDDTPEYVSWSPPRIHEPDEHGPRLWLDVQTLASAPPPIGEAYGWPSTPPEGD